MNSQYPILTDHRESSDTYRGELIRDGRFRVVVCRERMQWVFQRQRAIKAGVGGTWDALGFSRRRETLERLWREKSGQDAPAHLALLPERFLKPAAAIRGTDN